MKIQSQIEAKLKEAFAPVHLEVINESSAHNVPLGSETHFKVIVVSEEFEGQNRLERQRQIFDVLEIELQTGVHALAQRTYTPEEWESRGQEDSIPSPDCQKKNK